MIKYMYFIQCVHFYSIAIGPFFGRLIHAVFFEIAENFCWAKWL